MRVGRGFHEASMLNRVVLGDVYTSKDEPYRQR